MHLEKAIELATKAHEGQKDKGGEPYILHPLRVMMEMDTDEERIVAVLHDALEDGSKAVRDYIRQNLRQELLVDLESLSRNSDYHPYSYTYLDFIKKIAIYNYPIAKKVKIADIKDNLREDRRKNISVDLVDRYERALAILEGKSEAT